MKVFLLKTSAFALTFVILMLALLTLSSKWVKQKGFRNESSESNLLFMPENQHFDLMFLGISHARNFSRRANHDIVTGTLNKTMINLAQGEGACGPNEQLFYFDYFLSKNNHVDEIIYVLSPPMLFSETLPIASNTFDKETLELPFLWRYLFFKSENKSARMLSYLQTKLSPNWLFITKPERPVPNHRALDSIDFEAVKKGQDYAYGGHLMSLKRFETATKVVEKTILLAKERGTKVLLMIPPALFGKWRGHKQTLAFARKMQAIYPAHVRLYDASETVLEPRYYYDNHHLNTVGISHFVENFLKPQLN